MHFNVLDIPGPVEVVPNRFEDDRGYFSETFRNDLFRQHCGNYDFIQENQSLSRSIGTIRGLHFQTSPCAQGKLVRCAAGSIFDVAVDLRTGSPDYGGWIAVILTPGKGNQLWVPPGFAHGFCTLEPDTVVAYKVTSYYSAGHDKGMAWDDADVAVDWPAAADPQTLSAKDRLQPRLADLPALFAMELA